jgi:hypothetical protein
MTVHRPSPAMLVALTALIVSLGGSSYAAVTLAAKDSVTSKAIKDGQVKRADLARNAVGTDQVAAGSLLASDFKRGQLPAGAQGPKGDKGDKGDKGLTNFAVRANAGQQPAAVVATCGPGEVAISGGAHSFDGVLDAIAPVGEPTAIFTTGVPSFLGYTPTAWTGSAFNGTGDAHVTAWVVCATQ